MPKTASSQNPETDPTPKGDNPSNAGTSCRKPFLFSHLPIPTRQFTAKGILKDIPKEAIGE